MSQFDRPTEEKIEQLTGLFTATLLEKQNQFCKKLITKITWTKREREGSLFSFLSIKNYVTFGFYFLILH